MGDKRRFDLFADFVASNFRCDGNVAEVASGNGKLYGALRARGFSSITGWDTRRRNAGPRHIFKYGRFNYQSAPRDYDLVVGMHPDQGTDHVLGYAVKHRVPFAVCPCCVLPSAFKYEGYKYEHWISHLMGMAEAAGFHTIQTSLPMTGRNIVIAGWPPTYSLPRPNGETHD